MEASRAAEQGVFRESRLARPWASIALVVLGALIAFSLLMVYNVVNPGPPRLTKQDVNAAIAVALASLTPPPPAAVHAYERIRPSLVEIEAVAPSGKGGEQKSFGTGIVLDANGSILTCLHVVNKASRIRVGFADSTWVDATLAVSRIDTDIAVLKVGDPPGRLVPATLGDPHALQVGDLAIVVGNPLGLTDSLTRGTISALRRSFPAPGSATPVARLIQFDAAVNPGNSGGPLLNGKGEVVGIVTGLANPTGADQFAGIGFAVPIDIATASVGPALH